MYWGVSQFDWGVSHSARPWDSTDSGTWGLHGSRTPRPGSTPFWPGSTPHLSHDLPHISGGIYPAFRLGSNLHFGQELPCISAGIQPKFLLGSALQIKPRHQVPPAVVLGSFAVLLGSFAAHPPLCWRSFLMYFGSFTTPR